MRTEEVFDVSLPDDECGQIRTIGDLYKLILQKLHLPYIESGEVEAQAVGRIRPLPQVIRLSPWTTPDVWLTLKEVIHDQLGVKRSSIVETASFVDDLRCD